MPVAAFCLIFGTLMAVFGAMLAGASRNTHEVSAYARTARSLGQRLVPIGLTVAGVGMVLLAVVLVRGG